MRGAGPQHLLTELRVLGSLRVKQVLLAQAEAEKIRKIGEAEAADLCVSIFVVRLSKEKKKRCFLSFSNQRQMNLCLPKGHLVWRPVKEDGQVNESLGMQIFFGSEHTRALVTGW